MPAAGKARSGLRYRGLWYDAIGGKERAEKGVRNPTLYDRDSKINTLFYSGARGDRLVVIDTAKRGKKEEKNCLFLIGVKVFPFLCKDHVLQE